MTAPLPTLRRNQAMAVKSADVRHRRSILKRQLSTGDVHLADLLDQHAEWAARMRLEDILMALPRIGRRICERALVASRTNGWTTLEGITQRQREALLEHFRDEHPSIWTLWNLMKGES